jgi:hypothetical protein
MPEKFDYTALSTFLVCRKKYYWRMVRGLVGKRPPLAAEFGRCIHKALDVWYKTHDKKASKEAFSSTFVESQDDDKRTQAVGAKLLDLYFEKYENEPFKVIASELEFNVPLLGNISLIGRIDKIIDWEGAIYVMDHKTTSRLGYEFFYKIKPNMQFDGYIYAARKLGYSACSGIVLDALLVAKGLVVPAQLSRLTPLARDISTRSEQDMKRYVNNVSSILWDLERAYAMDTWYDNTESCCDFIECPYRKICKEDEDMHERIIEMDYKVEPWDPTRKEGE